MDAYTTVYHDDGTRTELRGTGIAVRCASVIAHENVPDAEWALAVLNLYGHLVPHASQRPNGLKRAGDWRYRCEDCDQRQATRWAYNEAECIGPNRRVCQSCHELACEMQAGAL